MVSFPHLHGMPFSKVPTYLFCVQSQMSSYADPELAVIGLDAKLLCKSGVVVPSTQRCLLDIDEYGDVIGCRDLSHLDHCGKFYLYRDAP